MGYDEIDLPIVEKLRQENTNFVSLENEHKVLNNRVKELDSNKYLSPDEEINLKELKKKKLSIKEKISKMIEEKRS